MFGTDLDIFLKGLYPDFEEIEDQGQESIDRLKKAHIADTSVDARPLFLVKDYSNTQKATFTYVTGADSLGKRSVGGLYPEVSRGKRGYLTIAEFDPDDEDAGKISIEDEWRDRLNPKVVEAIGGAKQLMNRAIREIWKRYFMVFEYAFTAPSSYPSYLFSRGNSADNPSGALDIPLMSSKHPLVNTSDTGVNVLTDSPALSESALWQAIELGGNMVDDWGEKMPISFGEGFTLIIPNNRTMVPLALQLVGCDKEPYTADNNVNLFKGVLGDVLVSPYLTGSKWFIVSKDRHPIYGTGLLDVTFVPLTTKGPVYDEATDSVVWKLKYEKRLGWVDFRYIIGSKGDGSTYTS